MRPVKRFLKTYVGIMKIVSWVFVDLRLDEIYTNEVRYVKEARFVMEQQIKETIALEIAKFHLPRYDDIPNVGLYLEQTVNYINEYLHPIQEGAITGSMISNYVKKKLVDNPIRKQYDREQIAAIVFIAVTKSVLSLDNISVLLNIRKDRYEIKEAYDYFCEALEMTIREVFGLRHEPGFLPDTVAQEREEALSDEKREERDILQNTIVAVANKLYLDQWISRYAAASRPASDTEQA